MTDFRSSSASERPPQSRRAMGSTEDGKDGTLKVSASRLFPLDDSSQRLITRHVPQVCVLNNASAASRCWYSFAPGPAARCSRCGFQLFESGETQLKAWNSRSGFREECQALSKWRKVSEALPPVRVRLIARLVWTCLSRTASPARQAARAFLEALAPRNDEGVASRLEVERDSILVLYEYTKSGLPSDEAAAQEWTLASAATVWFKFLDGLARLWAVKDLGLGIYDAATLELTHDENPTANIVFDVRPERLPLLACVGVPGARALRVALWSLRDSYDARRRGLAQRAGVPETTSEELRTPSRREELERDLPKVQVWREGRPLEGALYSSYVDAFGLARAATAGAAAPAAARWLESRRAVERGDLDEEEAARILERLIEPGEADGCSLGPSHVDVGRAHRRMTERARARGDWRAAARHQRALLACWGGPYHEEDLEYGLEVVELIELERLTPEANEIETVKRVNEWRRVALRILGPVYLGLRLAGAEGETLMRSVAQALG